ncbi:hypothetical protein B0H63DRAFT_551511 [Podospora didyma]|uniref:Fucose-specific lectin n=1 Tax=Podospora didyma TaxID=330526 RepID=A0AAE0KAQ7_9PEZI|nr:hypothetical protein B0H63DRAFT_551511 [Podospora didyma]
MMSTTPGDNVDAHGDMDTSKIFFFRGQSDLQVVDESCLPEVSQNQPPKPRFVSSDPEFASSLPSSKYGFQPEPHDVSRIQDLKTPQHITPVKPQARWARERRLWVFGIIAILLLVGISVGLGVGLGLKKQPSDAPALEKLGGDGANTTSIRRQLLAVTAVNSTLYVFARGQDNDIWFRMRSTDSTTANRSATWGGDWSKPFGDGSSTTFSGPPTAVTWEENRINVFAPSSRLANVLTASFVNGAWSNGWGNLGVTTASPVALCKMADFYPGPGDNGTQGDYLDRIDQWITDNKTANVFHNFWLHEDNGFLFPDDSSGWDSTTASLPSAAMPAAVCHKADPLHTLLLYGEGTDSLRMRYWLNSTGDWTPWIELGGNFRGDPVVVSVGQGEQFHFFGIGADKKMYTFLWSNGTQSTSVEYRPELRSLDGSFSSVPSAIVTETGNSSVQVHVIGRGTDGFVKHRVFRDGAWDANWEDLGVQTNTAPLTFSYSNPIQGSWTGMAFIGSDNKLQFATWQTSNNSSWKDLVKWTDAGGNLTTQSMCL